MTVIYTSRIVDTPAWDAGASLVDTLPGSGAYQFTVGQSVGIVCGLSPTDLSVFYGEISHAFWIETGRCKVMEAGASKTGFFTTTPATVFKIERQETTVRYYMDGVLCYTSTTPSVGTVLLDSSLYAYNDTIATVERIVYDGQSNSNTFHFSAITGFGIADAEYGYGSSTFRFPAFVGGGETVETHSHLVFPALTGFGIENANLAYGELQFPAFTGYGEVTDGALIFPPLVGTGFEQDGMGEGWLAPLAGTGSTPMGEAAASLSAFIGWGIAADGDAAGTVPALTGFGVEDGVFYGQCALPALTGTGYEVYDRPDFNQGWFFLRSLRGYGNDYPDFDGEAALELPLYARGTDTDLVGGLTFPALRVDGQLQYGAYFNIPVQLNLQSIAYNSIYDRLTLNDALAGEITAATFSDSVKVTTQLTGKLTNTSSRSDTGYATDALLAGFTVASTETVNGSDTLGGSELTAVPEAFAGEIDGGLVSDTLASVNSITSSTTETVVLYEQESAVFSVSATDTGTVQETLLGPLSLWASTTDGVVLSEAQNQDWTVSGVSDQLDAADAVNAAYEVAEANTVAAADALVLQLDLVGETTEAVTVTVVLNYSAQETGPCDEAVTVSEVLALPIYQHAPELADAATAADTLALPTSEYIPVADGGKITDALLLVTTNYAALTDTVTATTAVTSASNLTAALADSAVLTETLLESTQTLYVVNADTGAVSTYALSPVVSGLAQYHDLFYVAGPEGLYALDAADDDGTDITWTVHTGFSNWGTDSLKRVLDVNLQARIQEDTTLALTTDRYGQKQTHRYRLPELTRDSYRDGVVKLGKGIQSVYWQLVLQGLGEAEIDQIRVRLESLSRRR